MSELVAEFFSLSADEGPAPLVGELFGQLHVSARSEHGAGLSAGYEHAGVFEVGASETVRVVESFVDGLGLSEVGFGCVVVAEVSGEQTEVVGDGTGGVDPVESDVLGPGGEP